MPETVATSVAIGLLAANVLTVNNYRDKEDDEDVGKYTTVVVFGRKVMGRVYLLSGILAMVIMTPLWMQLPVWALLAPIIYLVMHIATWRKVIKSRGAELNPLLGRTALNLFCFTLLLLVVFIIYSLYYPEAHFIH